MSRIIRHFWTLYFTLLGLSALALLPPLLRRGLAYVEIDSDEGWNVVRALRAAAHVKLYARPPGLDFTNYPPLSFHLIGALSVLGLDPLFTGRALALLALLGLGALAGVAVAWLCGQAWQAACAGLGFILFLALFMPVRVAVDDPQLLGMLAEMAGFVLFLRRGPLWLVACLFVLALFTKHSLLALPIGVGVSLLWQRRWAELGLLLAACAALADALLWLSFRFDGPYFFAHLLAPRAFSWRDMASQTGSFLVRFWPLLALAIGWGWQGRRQPARQACLLALIAALILGIVFSGGDGVGLNVFFEALWLCTLMAVLAGTAQGGWRRFALLWPLLFLPMASLEAWRELETLPQARAEFAAARDALQAIKGPVVCENLLLCTAAGHQSSFSPYFVASRIRDGKLSAAQIDTLLSSHSLAAVQIGATDRPIHRPQFTPDFLDTLHQDYRPLQQGRTLSLWVPRQPPGLPPGLPGPNPAW